MNTTEPPRFRGAPPQCVKANLPSFESETALREWMEKNSPRCLIRYVWQCESCGGFHADVGAPDPAGDSSGTGRSKKGK